MVNLNDIVIKIELKILCYLKIIKNTKSIQTSLILCILADVVHLKLKELLTLFLMRILFTLEVFPLLFEKSCINAFKLCIYIFVKN